MESSKQVEIEAGYLRVKAKCRALREIDPRAASEHEFAAAELAFQLIDRGAALYHKKECLRLLAKANTDSLKNCAARNIEIEGVLLPGLFREDTVKSLLAHIT